MEEPDEEWNSKGHPSEANSGKMSWNGGLRLCKQILVAGFMASSAPVVIPPLVVVSAIGLAVSVPYCLFLASHACTEKLMSKLLPRPSHHPLYWSPCVEGGEKEEVQHQKVVCFEGDIDIDKEEEEELPEETNREIKMRMELDDVENIKELENNMTLENDHRKGVVKKDEPEISQDAMDVLENYDSKGGSSDYIREKVTAPAGRPTDVKLETDREAEVEEIWMGETKGEEIMFRDRGIVITLEGLDKIGDDIEEFKTPFEVANVTLEELGDHVIEGDIEEAELKNETKGLLENIRDEGKIDNRWKCLKEIQANVNEMEKSPIENELGAGEDELGGTIVRIEREVINQGYPKISEEKLERHTEKMNPFETEEESDEPRRGMLEEKSVDDRKDSDRQMEELCGLLSGGIVLNESIPTEPIGFSLEERQGYHTMVVEGSDADAREIADESGFDLFDAKCIEPQEYSCTVNLYEESNAMTNDHTDPMELPVLSAEHNYRQFEYSSGNDTISSSNEIILSEKIWKQIHAMRMIVGYEGTAQASCVDELKALYIFTGVEPPTFVNNSLAEINDKLHFLMSIVGVKSNVA
ncbi:hypothetical protein L6164_035250 [Bauhinia variegata]|uniref:Uncharacterized protein n=1 Tax=Bauhinia variegata TaxID=167791 RepID=A0ACB9KX22_BAUVA|nr:hypothetical protein L6164_035250 [Bauhinia variegata]